ncbi:peptidase [Pasteurella skyensis]|uniref:Peptidase n=1 Tax=Phocoenobacter skyensis TaxID=97481 RepID=A0AAJ6N9C6_9PAST|nr:peptidase [Pasteurella skyensis]MDP8162811.1 peptidase [Pasteurella skyensis]MDP8172602.1 peptidase [Pasteurella skyensis]MDP8179102.1 peptidase [Pasteurella skyensis]MDP8183213.1 peptidase [Pasteurella skyensis]MDP8189264.1 peptidase [Pasteurella skyensis]
MSDTNVIEIFRAGTRKDANGNTITISVDDLNTIVKNYNPVLHEAPIVIGHPKTDTPAYGWIDALFVEGDILKATPKQVDAEFAELVNTGKYKKISSAFYLPNSASNPKPEGFYLRHVGFLGAKPPAVKGLKDPIFNDNSDDVVEFSDWESASLFQSLRDFFIEKFGLEEADKALPAWKVESIKEDVIREQERKYQTKELPIFNEPENKPKDLQGEPMSEEDKKKLAELEAENSRLKAERAAEIKAQTEKENAEFAESLVSEGKLIPKLKQQAIDLLNAETGSAEFSETDFKSNLKTFLSELPQAVEFSEIATKENAATGEFNTVEYAETDDPARIELDRKARAYMEKNNVDYATAISAVA